MPAPDRGAIAGRLGIARSKADGAVPSGDRWVLIAESWRIIGVTVVGVDNSPRTSTQRTLPRVSRHTEQADQHVTVIIDLIPIRVGSDPSQLLDMRGGTPSRCSRPSSYANPKPGAGREGRRYTDSAASRTPPTEDPPRRALYTGAGLFTGKQTARVESCSPATIMSGVKGRGSSSAHGRPRTTTTPNARPTDSDPTYTPGFGEAACHSSEDRDPGVTPTHPPAP